MNSTQTNKLALVVDDSRSARMVLQRMLEKYGLEVSTCESAEEAIEYLLQSNPAVIFMDHLMQGMDGFQAMEAIKRNPATATIPIIMYTAREGEVYVGRARALGAFDVLSKSIQPKKLQAILSGLNLLDANQPPATANKNAQKAAPIAQAAAKSRVPQVEINDNSTQKLIDQMANRIRFPDIAGAFVDLRLELRRDIKAITRAQSNKLEQDLEELRYETRDRFTQFAEVQNKSPKYKSAALLALGFLFAMPIAWLLGGQSDSSPSSLEIEQRLHRLEAENQQLQNLLANFKTPTTNNREQSSPQESTLAAIEWLANQQASLGYSQVPLDDQQMVFVNELLDRLDTINFRGRIDLEVHVGNFCLVQGNGGELVLPEKNIALDQCEQLGYAPEEALDISRQQSINFSNFVHSSPLLSSGKIKLNIGALGNSRPKLPYPDDPTEANSREWNQIAAANSRLNIRFISK